MAIIGLSGRIGSGKDEAAKRLQKLLQKQEDTDMGFTTWEHKKFATKLKQIASILTGHAEEDFEDRNFKENKYLFDYDMSVRTFLQKLGTNAIREHLHKDAWVNALLADYDIKKNWIISDVRFPNEAQAIDELGGLTIKLTRAGSHSSVHASETALDAWNFDYVIDNNGTLEELQKQLEDFVNTSLKIKQ